MNGQHYVAVNGWSKQFLTSFHIIKPIWLQITCITYSTTNINYCRSLNLQLFENITFFLLFDRVGNFPEEFLRGVEFYLEILCCVFQGFLYRWNGFGHLFPSYNHVQNILRLFDGSQILLLPQVKRTVILSNKLVYTSCLTSCRTTSDFRNWTRKILLKNINWTFPVVRYFTWKLEFVSNILWMIVSGKHFCL